MWLGANNRSGTSASPLQVGINGLVYYEPQQLFLNLFKEATTVSLSVSNASNWITQNSGTFNTNEEAYLQLDSDGYAKSLVASPTPSGGQQFTWVATWMLFHLGVPPGGPPIYPTGTYRFQFKGSFTMEWHQDPVSGTFVSHTAGVTVSGTTITSTLTGEAVGSVTFSVTSAVNGFDVHITAIPDSSNYPRFFSLVHTNWTSLYDAGQVFHPNFLSILNAAPFKAFRCMDILQTPTQVITTAFGGNGGVFTTPPLSGNTGATLTSAWPNPSGTYLITLRNGQDFAATFTVASTTVAFNGTVGTSCTDASWYLHQINGWANRPQLSWMSYAGPAGAPYEICFQLANVTGINPWINVPPSFIAVDWDSLGQLMVSQLSPSLVCYVEWSNEVWNSAFAVQAYAFDKSVPLYGSGDRDSYYGQQVSLMADRLAIQLGNPGFDNRCIVLMSGQAVNTAILTTEMAAASWVALGNTAPYLRTSASGQKTIKAVAIAPYFGFSLTAADYTHLTGLGDGGYTDFFAMFQQNPVNGYSFTAGSNPYPANGAFGLSASWITAHIAALAAYGAPQILAYEGGWGFQGNGTSPDQSIFLATAARDSRMADLSRIYYRTLLHAGCAMPAQFVLISPAYGTTNGFEFGVLENPLQAENSPLSSTPPRFQGMVEYVLNG